MIIYVDIDGTICNEIKDEDIDLQLSRKRAGENIENKKDYGKAEPYKERIKHINSLYDKGHSIHYWTARGARSKIDWTELTRDQLKKWGCKYHSLSVGTKPHFDVYICDKSFNADSWFAHYINEKNELNP